jgi:hypothetical protein
MASKWRDVAEASWIDHSRNGVVTGEKLFVEVADSLSGGTDIATLPKIGAAYDDDNSLCILTSFRKNQYKGSQLVSYLCRYTTEEVLSEATGYPVPREKFTAGGEMYSLSKDFVAKWTTAPTDAINQVSQLLIPNGQFELNMTTDEKATAYSTMIDWIGGISKTKPKWLAISGEVIQCVGVKGNSIIDTSPTQYYRTRLIFAYRQDSANLGWNALFRETTGEWQLTDKPVYQEIEDFASLMPI